MKPLSWPSFSSSRIVAGFTGLVMALSLLLAPSLASAWALYNNTNQDLRYRVFDTDNVEIRSGSIRANRSVSCGWGNEADCNPNGRRGSELRVVFQHGGSNWSCAVTLLGAGNAMVYSVIRDDVDPNVRNHWWCLSQINEKHKGGNQDIDVNGDGKYSYVDIDWSDPFLVNNRNGGYRASNRNVKFFVTADPQIDNADIGWEDDDHCNVLDECSAQEEEAMNAQDVFQEFRRAFRPDRYGYQRRNSNYRGVLVAGDLTQWARWDEWKFYSQISTNQLQPDRYPMEKMYEGLGNHDKAQEDTEDCWTEPEFRSGWCDFSTDIHKYVGSHRRNDRMSHAREPHYSWEWHDVHFVQLNTFPGDSPTNDRPTIDPFEALRFLRNDLEQNVGNSGRPVVLVHHYGFDQFSMEDIQCNNDREYNPKMWWTERDRIDYWNLLTGYNVVAIFTGHNHLGEFTGFSGREQDRRDGNGILYEADGVTPLRCRSPGWGETFKQPDGADNRIFDARTEIPAFIAGGAGNGIYLDVTMNACNEMTIERRKARDAIPLATHTLDFTSPTSPKSTCSLDVICTDADTSADANCQGFGSVKASGGLGACLETPPMPYPLGVTTVQVDCPGIDIDGNVIGAGQCDAVMTVLDRTSPDVLCPDVADTVECGVDLLGAGPDVSDNCDANPVATCTPALGATAALDMNSLTCEYTDMSLNHSTCDRSFDVVDTLDPVVTLQGAPDLGLECGIDTYTEAGASALDQCDGAPGVVIGGDTVDTTTPGSYALTYTAADSSGNSGHAGRTVTVSDTRAPAIACDADITVEPASPSGTAVSFGATGTDACDTAPVIICPESGNTFAVGSSNQVSCTAIDASQNQSGCSLTVRVLSEAELLAKLEDQVAHILQSSALNGGQGRALDTKLRNILRSIEAGNTAAACDQVGGFTGQLEEWVGDGTLLAAETSELRESAGNLAATLACDG